MQDEQLRVDSFATSVRGDWTSKHLFGVRRLLVKVSDVLSHKDQISSLR